MDSEFEVSIYPSPASTVVTISSSNQIAIDKVNIYNQLGQIVQQIRSRERTLHVAGLDAGLYIVEIVCGQKRHSMKLIVECYLSILRVVGTNRLYVGVIIHD